MGELKRGIIKSRKRNERGELIGTSNSNPLLDTRLYTIEFDDGTYGEYTTNIVMETFTHKLMKMADKPKYLKKLWIIDVAMMHFRKRKAGIFFQMATGGEKLPPKGGKC